MSKINVILAEDELALGTIIQESLESRDFKVRLCGDGQKAWESYQSQKPDVLVLDVMMPKKRRIFARCRDPKNRSLHADYFPDIQKPNRRRGQRLRLGCQ
ncbi:response regulator [Algoriphagus boritolerans]|uniref:response regulator n=1 Tax=Algoriphagus boritolerans TaxID=308111 RepID=UPI000A4EE294